MKQSTSTKSQIFSLDMIFAVIVFLLVFTTTIFAWDELQKKWQLQQTRDDMESIAENVAQTLLTTPGQPANWEELQISSSNISSIGIASSPHLLSTDKISELESVYPTKYEEIKKILGIRGAGYQFQIKVIYDPGDYTLLGSHPVIAYTYANSDGGPEEGDAANFGIRSYLDENEIEYTNYYANWQKLISEIWDYNVVIMEDPWIDDSSLSTAQKNTLKDWVADGNMYIQKEQGTIIKVFGIKINRLGEGDFGIVVALDRILYRVDIGDEIKCIEGYRLSKGQGGLVTLVEHTSGHVLMGYVNYTLGQVIYLCDTQGQAFFNTSRIEQYDNVRYIINFGGGLATIKVGDNPVNATLLVREERVAMLDNNLPARLIVKIWKT
ncbi:MAG: hypothetical protein ABIG95_07160 [Candidatus Woesearchaeota archaeon]